MVKDLTNLESYTFIYDNAIDELVVRDEMSE